MFYAIKGGCNAKHKKGFHISRPNGLDHYVILIIKSHGEFVINGISGLAAPGNAIVLAPNTPYSYGNPNDSYSDDWLHFELPDHSCFEKYQKLTNQLFPIKNADFYTFYIRQILWESSYGAKETTRENTNALFTVLLNHLLTDFQDQNDITAGNAFQIPFQNLRLSIQNSVAERHTIKKHAKDMGINEYYFQHLYSQFFGISFQQDLIQMRIDYAKYILETSSLSIEQVAEISGYTNEVHFFRQFKQITGITPARYRKSVQ